MRKSHQIFLAHASEDKEIVRKIYKRLESLEFKLWLDEANLIAGQNWRIEIPKAIRNSDIFIAFLSQQSIKKQGYVQKEFRLALNAYAEKPVGTSYLIPVKLNKCEAPDLQIAELSIRLSDIQWIDFWKEDGFERLVQAIEYTLRTLES